MALNDEDLGVIRAHGLPAEPDPRYLVVSDDGGVTLTARGRELYRVAMHMYGRDPDCVDAVQTRDDLREITGAVKEVRVRLVAAEARESLRKGEIPVLSRGMLTAALDGSIAEFADSVEHAERCSAAGPNVMP